MSNDTQNSRDSGDNRRRRSRGGQNRRTNNNNNSERRNSDERNSDGRQSGGARREGGRTDGRQNTGSGSGKPQRRPMPSPIKLTWWQKLLKTIGLYKEPVRPPRPERRPDQADSEKTREPRRPKTREPRSQGNREEREERGNREERGERGRHQESNQDQDSPRRGKQRRERNDRGPRGGDPSTVENRRVYVGNLSYETTESDLEELFKGVGAVRRVEIVYNRSTHRSKGYGFIEMIDIDEAKRTVEVLHDQFFMGRKLTVSGAKSPDHETAESDEQDGTSDNNNVMPPLAPIKPEVTNLIDEPLTETAPEPEPLPEIVAEIEHPEIPTEEFSPEADVPEEIKEQVNS